MNDCPFCHWDGPTVRDYGDVFVIEPVDPVTEGHVLVIPRLHVRDFSESLIVTETVMFWAARYVREYELDAFNVITSKGKPATQSVFHLHVHVVPRRLGDGLRLPWT